jgi:uncharacterized membrane protein
MFRLYPVIVLRLSVMVFANWKKQLFYNKNSWKTHVFKGISIAIERVARSDGDEQFLRRRE